MKRVTGFPTRPDMVQQLLNVGFDYYNLPSSDGSHYWSDNVAYEFTLAEIDRIEDTTNELHLMCLDFAADEIKKAIMKIIVLRSCKNSLLKALGVIKILIYMDALILAMMATT